MNIQSIKSAAVKTLAAGTMLAATAYGETVCYFDGSTYIDMGKSFPLADSVSLSAWVRVDPRITELKPRGGGYSGAGIVGQGYWGGNNGLGFLAAGAEDNDRSNDRIAWQVRAGGLASGSYYDPALFTDGEWHHCLLVRDKENGTARFYIDGVLCSEEQSSVASMGTSSTTFAVGKNIAGIGGCFCGYIADVALWNVALSTADAARLPHVGVNHVSIAPYAYFPLDEGTGNSVTGTDNGSSLTCGASGTLSWENDPSFLRGGSPDVLYVSSTLDGVGSPSPAYGDQTGLSAGQTISVSCGTTPWTNATMTASYACAGWKLYDADGNEVSSGTETSFTYTHPNTAEYRRLEWQWTVTYVKGTFAAGEGGSISPSGDAWYAVGAPVTVTATPNSGNPFVCWMGTLPDGISASSASVTFTPSAPFEMTAMFTLDFYVAATGDDGNPGTKAAPFATIDAAVAAANDFIAGGLPSANIRVADGDYTLSGQISVAAPISIVGESGNRDAVIVRASANNRAFVLNHASATISGISVLGGGANVAKAGGNIYIDAGGGIVTNCVVANGRGPSGGNIAMGSGSVVPAASSMVVDCVISNGTDTTSGWDSAGNIYSLGGRIQRCVISDGYVAVGNGGGNALVKACTMENCLITGGSGGNASATICTGIAVNGEARIVNCTIVGNRPPTGTSMYAIGLWNSAANAKIVNCVIYGNGDGGQDVAANRVSSFSNCAFSSDGANCADTVSPVTTLTDEDFKNYARGKYAPKPDSALVNAGSSERYAAYAISATDLAGNPRVIKKMIDIGCYEALSGIGFQLIVR